MAPRKKKQNVPVELTKGMKSGSIWQAFSGQAMYLMLLIICTALIKQISRMHPNLTKRLITSSVKSHIFAAMRSAIYLDTVTQVILLKKLTIL